MTARVSLLLYFVVEELLVSELLVLVCVEVAVDSMPSPAGAAVRSAIRSSRAISQTAAATGCGTCVLGTKFVNTGDIVVLTGSVPVLPRAALESLPPGGRIFAVVGEAPVMTAKIVTCTAPGAYRAVELFETLLAPLVNCERPSRFRF